MKDFLRTLLRKNSLLISILMVFFFFNLITGGKLIYAQNLSNLLLQNGYVIILACGMLLCILTGGNIDLSVGCTVCLSGAIVAVLFEKTALGVLPVCLIALAAAVLVGVWNGYFIGYFHIPPFVVTLGSMFIVRGLAREVLGSKTVSVSNRAFSDLFTSYIRIPVLDDGLIKYSALILGLLCCILLVVLKIRSHAKNRTVGVESRVTLPEVLRLLAVCLCLETYAWKLANCEGVPVMLLWVVGVVLLYHVLTRYSVFGRHLYAIGGNLKASRLSGINTRKVMFLAYLQVGLLAGLCGLIYAARIGSVNGDAGTQYEMDAIGSCFIGGVSAYGGFGKVTGAITGAILMGIINQGMSIYGLSTNWQYVVKGAVLLAAVVSDLKMKHRRQVS